MASIPARQVHRQRKTNAFGRVTFLGLYPSLNEKLQAITQKTGLGDSLPGGAPLVGFFLPFVNSHYLKSGFPDSLGLSSTSLIRRSTL